LPSAFALDEFVLAFFAPGFRVATPLSWRFASSPGALLTQSPRHRLFFFLAQIGIPLYMFLMLFKYRNKLLNPGVRAELGFLYDAYERDVWYFEMAGEKKRVFRPCRGHFRVEFIPLASCSLCFVVVRRSCRFVAQQVGSRAFPASLQISRTSW
jgi:hypothetical protein